MYIDNTEMYVLEEETTVFDIGTGMRGKMPTTALTLADYHNEVTMEIAVLDANLWEFRYCERSEATDCKEFIALAIIYTRDCFVPRSDGSNETRCIASLLF